MTPEQLQSYVAERQKTLDVVRGVLIKRLRVPRQPEEIDPDVPLFGTGLGLDSVDAIELMVAIETELEVELGDGAAARSALRTVNTLVDLVLHNKQAGES